MELNQQKIYRTKDTDDEKTLLSNKRIKIEETDKNPQPPTNTDSPLTHQQNKLNFFESNIKSATKSSAASINLLKEMGLGILDSDESNQSSGIENALAEPKSTISLIASENSSEPISSNVLIGSQVFSENDSNTENQNENILNEISCTPGSDTILNEVLLSDSTGNENSFVSSNSKSAQFHIHKDLTPANLIPFTRTNFSGIVSSATGSSFEATSYASALRTSNSVEQKQQPEGRAIRNTSLKKFNTQELDSGKKYKGRSPLATVSCNSNQKQISHNQALFDVETAKKMQHIGCDESFFMYQKHDPRIYTGEDNFASLSDEMILSVFKWLPKKTLSRCSLVNHRFNRVAQDESLWTRLDLAGKTIQPWSLGRIILRGVIILRLAQCKILEPIFRIVELPNDYLAKLQYLDLSMAVIPPSGLVELFSRCRQLKKLSLEHVPIDDMVCKELANNRKIEVLNLAMCTGLTRHGVRKLLSSFKHLHTLNISWTSLESDTILEFSNYVNENLLRLNIAGCRKTMTDESLTKLVNRCPLLCELDISDCTLLTSQTIDIVSKLKHLEHLSLSRCYNINVAAYLEINKLNSIAYLDIFGVLSDQALNVLRDNFPEIGINKFIHSAAARPTVGSRRTSIWGLRTRD